MPLNELVRRRWRRRFVSRHDQEARLRKHVVTEQQQVTVPVSHEELRVEREPITDANRGDAYDGPSISEEEHEVTLRAERPVVSTETEAVERVRLGTETVRGRRDRQRRGPQGGDRSTSRVADRDRAEHTSGSEPAQLRLIGKVVNRSITLERLTTSRARAMESGLPPPANVTTGRSDRASTALTERMRRSTLGLLCEGLQARTA